MTVLSVAPSGVGANTGPELLYPERLASAHASIVARNLFSEMGELIEARRTLEGMRLGLASEVGERSRIIWVPRFQGNETKGTAYALTRFDNGPFAGNVYVEFRHTRPGRWNGASVEERLDMGLTVTHVTTEYSGGSVSFACQEYTDKDYPQGMPQLNFGRAPVQMVPLAIGGIQESTLSLEHMRSHVSYRMEQPAQGFRAMAQRIIRIGA